VQSNLELVHEYLSWQRDVRRRSGGTLYGYEGVLRAWIDWLDVTHLSQATVEDVEAFSQRLRPSRKGRVMGPGSDATVSKDVVIVGTLHSFLAARYGWPNPAVLAGRPKVRNRNPKPISDGDWAKLWGSKLPPEGVVALGLMTLCGLRRAEVVGLRASHLDMENLRIVDFTRKGGGTDTVEIGAMLEHWRRTMPNLLGRGGEDRLQRGLESLLSAAGGGALLPWQNRQGGPTTAHSVTTHMRTWMVRAGFGPDDFTPHQLRHTFVTNMLRTDVPLDVVCELANHSDPKITMRYRRVAGGVLRDYRRTAERFMSYAERNA
jgi:site-specific recombinase XerD